MIFHRVVGLFAVIPATMLLTVSFFVLFALRKIESGGLKAFGYVIAALLWAGALLFVSAGIYKVSTGKPAMMKCPMMQTEMKGKCCDNMMGGKMRQMMEDKAEGQMMKH